MNILACQKKRSQDYAKGHDDGVKDGIRVAIKVIMFGIVQYLGDKRGWKRERIFEALQWLQKYANMQVENYTTFKEVVEAVKDEYGITENDGIFYLLTDEGMKNEK